MAINRIIYDVSGEAIVDTNGQVTVYGIDGNGHTVNKVQYGQTVLMDITDTTATASDVAMGEYFYTNDGVKRTGTKSDATPINVNSGTASVSNETITIASGAVNLQAKSNIDPTSSSQTITADSGYDGLSSVQINAIPSSYVQPSGSLSITANNTYDVTNYASVVVNVASSGSTYKTGTVSYSSTYNTTGNREIVSLATIGFTPKQFYLRIRDKSVVSGQQYAVLRASFETLNDNTYLRTTTRYSKTDGTTTTANSASSWTTQTNYYLYCNGSSIYFRTTSAYIILTGTSYDWIAIP